MVQPVNEYAYIAAMNCVTMNTIAVYMENEPTADRRGKRTSALRSSRAIRDRDLHIELLPALAYNHSAL